jgi:thymidine phosphorylase
MSTPLGLKVGNALEVEESVARGFIAAVKFQGLFVRETVVKLMREFTKHYGPVVEEKKKDEQ